ANRAIDANVKPIGMLSDPGMIGRALQGKIECDLELELAGSLDQAPEVFERAQLRVHGGVPAVLRADRPRAAMIAGLCGPRIVVPLAMGLADGMDRRQVHHVETERSDVGQTLLGVPKRAMLTVHGALRAGKQLVPAGKCC